MGCTSSNSEKFSVKDSSFANVAFLPDFFDHYYLDKKLTQGQFAQVRALAKLPSAYVAVDEEIKLNDEGNTGSKGRCAKILDLRDRRRPGKACPEKRDLAAMEVHHWKSVGHHPNCAKLVGAYLYENICFIVTEKCNRSLYHHMKDMPDLTELSLAKLVHQMLSALCHLHSVRLVHRDVRADNFLVGGMLGDTVKLCDFGLATSLPAQGKVYGPVGTAGFMCPEMLTEGWYDEKADIWSLGVTVYALLFGNFPCQSKGTEGDVMIQSWPPSSELADKESRSPEASDFVHALLQPCAENRPSAAEASNHSYMATVATGRDMNGVAMPSLRPMLDSARMAGAIATVDMSQRTDLDNLVSKVQFQKLGVRMPDDWKSHQVSMAMATFSLKESRFAGA